MLEHGAASPRAGVDPYSKRQSVSAVLVSTRPWSVAVVSATFAGAYVNAAGGDAKATSAARAPTTVTAAMQAMTRIAADARLARVFRGNPLPPNRAPPRVRRFGFSRGAGQYVPANF